MRKTMIVITLCTLSLVSAPVFSSPGGPGHSHATGPISAEAAQEKATQHVAGLVTKGKIESSWNGIKPTKAYEKKFEKGPEWVVEFVNSAATDKTKQTLYVFYTLDGNYLAANFTGK